MRRVALIALLSIGCCIGCTGELPFLVVDFATDLPAGASFVAIETSLTRDGAPVADALSVARLGESFVEPRRLASFEGLEPGAYRVDVVLTDVAGDEVARRSTLVTVERSVAITVVISLSCVGVTCPATGDSPAATACYGGQCVDPRCSDDQPEYCTGACASDDACGGGQCVAGVCLGGPVAGCDDGDPCTDDAETADGCTHVPNTAACDDGVFCNGADTCLAGACTEHGSPPCDADRCDEAARRCDVGCLTDADCPAPVVGDWTACAGFSGVCGEDGTHTRRVTSFACEAGACAPHAVDEDEACTRTTDGTPCGARSCEPTWNDCVFSPCAIAGTQNRRCNDLTCGGGTCNATGVEYETRPCMRPSQEGMTCNPSGAAGFCTGTCAGGACGDLCASCGGSCTIVGCAGGTC
ncbi:MAG: hypothetical protein H6719_34335 [Sandaracinaceae bacterium]|nr:hypothetical protein [Sandaracinaceae bacterium]